MLWHILIKATHGTWSTFIVVLFDTLLELFYRRRGSTFNIFISQPNTVLIMFIIWWIWGHYMWWKGWFDIHATLFYQYAGVGGALSPWNTKINWGLPIIPWADGWNVGSRYSHNLPGLRFQDPPADDKNDLSSLLFCTGIHGTKYNCVLQRMLVHRDPKRAAIAPLTKMQSWTDFCVQLTLGSYTGPAWNKEVTQNGFGPCGSPFHGNEEWHLLQQLWCNTNRQLSYNEKKQLHLVRRFEHFLRILIRMCTHGEMVISTETDF